MARIALFTVAGGRSLSEPSRYDLKGSIGAIFC